MNKKYLRPGILLLILLIQFSFDSSAQNGDPSSLKLWYDEPASEWEEALPLGNGRLGVMVFGNTSKERIQLNDDSMWPGDLGWDQPEGKKRISSRSGICYLKARTVRLINSWWISFPEKE